MCWCVIPIIIIVVGMGVWGQLLLWLTRGVGVVVVGEGGQGVWSLLSPDEGRVVGVSVVIVVVAVVVELGGSGWWW